MGYNGTKFREVMEMIVVDSHCDSIQKVDAGKYGMVNPYNFSEKYRQLQFVALFCSWPGETPEESYRRAVRYLGNFSMAMAGETDRVLPVRTYADIEAAFAAGKHAAMLTLEGGTGLKGSPDILRRFFVCGVRVCGLTWLTNDLGKSNRLEAGEEDTGLTAAGRAVVEEGNRLGMIFDVSHLSDQSFWDLAELAAKPIIASHSNFRAVCGHSRNLTDDMAREIFRQSGMIGLNLCPGFVDEEKENQTVERLFAHLEHSLALGGEDHIGFGCDIDGTSGKYPAPLDESSPIHDRLIEYMLTHNYSETLVKKVAGANYLRFLRDNLPL